MLKDRLITAAVVLPLLVLVLWVGGFLLILFALVAFTVISYEYFFFAVKTEKLQLVQFTLCTLLLPLGYLWIGLEGFLAGFVLAAAIIFVLLLIKIEHEPHEPQFETLVPACFLGLVYPGLFGTVFVIVADYKTGNFLLTWLFFVVIFSDSGAYFVGRALGKRQLVPRLSPGKTVEGTVGGLICDALGSWLACVVLEYDKNAFEIIGYGLAAGILAQTGDLVESLVKRVYNVKDSGTLLPGHGGLLDRVDALLFAAPILFAVAL